MSKRVQCICLPWPLLVHYGMCSWGQSPTVKLCVLSCCTNVSSHAYTDPIDCAVFVSEQLSSEVSFSMTHNKCTHPVVHRDATANSGFICILASTARAASAIEKYSCLLCRALPPGSSVCVCVIAPSVIKTKWHLSLCSRLLWWGVNACVWYAYTTSVRPASVGLHFILFLARQCEYHLPKTLRNALARLTDIF